MAVKAMKLNHMNAFKTMRDGKYIVIVARVQEKDDDGRLLNARR